MSEHNFKVGDRVEYSTKWLRSVGLSTNVPTGLVIKSIDSARHCTVHVPTGIDCRTWKVLFSNLIKRDDLHKEPA